MTKKAPSPIDKHVGARVRMRRMMLGMSQEALGDAVKLTFQQIQKYEKGTNRIGASRLYEFATILNVPVSFFFEGLPMPGGSGGIKQSINDALSDFLGLPYAGELIKHYVAIAANSDRRVLVDVARVIATTSAKMKVAA